jgi:hypothetical protein
MNLFSINVLTTRQEMISFNLSHYKIKLIIHFHIRKAFKISCYIMFYRLILPEIFGFYNIIAMGSENYLSSMFFLSKNFFYLLYIRYSVIEKSSSYYWENIKLQKIK